ncbi:PAS domain-containing sensor histidine kinase [Melittangium boletus DSM 14713]|uniref:histidine kinase n=2 Tax=Melittangium boletus TaxID=83453 RepID=A0A250IIM6_9BACT|nr:PAS domain-containing sensor histidine kinase [Melittangium boletus DSM 14713]
MGSGGLDGITEFTGTLESVEPYGLVLLKRALDSNHPLLDAEWLMSTSAARRLLPGAECYRGWRVRDICAAQGEEFVRMLVRWENQLARRPRLSENVSYVLGERRFVFRADMLQSAEHLVVWIRDITERERMEQALRENETRYELVARATRDVLWDWNVARGEVSWSTSPGEVFGEAPGQGPTSIAWWRERIHPEDQQQALRTLHQVMSGQDDHWTNEYRFRRADGSYAFVLERGYIGRNSAGRPERLIGAMMDVSERQQREEDQAREARLLERFMGIIGHDLGSPLAAIRISSQMLQQAPNLTPAQRAALGRIEESARRVTRLTQQLLDSVLARNGGIPVQPRPTDLEQLCHRVLDEFTAIYPERSLQLTVEGDTHGQWDQDRLAQAISNLVGNALEHGEASHPVSLRLWDDAGVQRLEVNNRGAPIDPALMPHLFEPFRRGDPHARQVSGGGAGLGLFIVREIVRAHRGEVEVRSTPEEGTTFGLTLPRQQAPDAREP